MDVERVESGIPGLDKLIEGGFVRNSMNLLTGGTGTGKTIFANQFILHGLKNDENGVYITLEQSPEEIKADMSRFGWDFDKYIREKKCQFEYLTITNFDDLKFNIFRAISEVKAERLVIDSISLVSLSFEGKSLSELRHKIFDLMKDLKAKNITSLLVSETPDDGERKLSRFGMEEFVADSVIKIHYTGIGGEQFRNVEIRKMRRTDHSQGFHPLIFTKNGLSVKGEPISVLMK